MVGGAKAPIPSCALSSRLQRIGGRPIIPIGRITLHAAQARLIRRERSSQRRLIRSAGIRDNLTDRRPRSIGPKKSPAEERGPKSQVGNTRVERVRIAMLSRASSLVYGRLNWAAAELTKGGDQAIEGVRVPFNQHLAAILSQLVPSGGKKSQYGRGPWLGPPSPTKQKSPSL
jgi:hypothetical protein